MRYRNTAGEIEARDSASRRTLTAEERKKTSPKYGDGNNVRGNRYNTHRIVTPDGKVFKFSEKIKDTTRELSQGVTFSGSLAETTSVASKDNIRQSEKKVKQNFSIDDQAYLDAVESGDILAAYDKMLHKHPNDVYLLHGKAISLYRSFQKDQEMSVAKEIISLCKKINCFHKPDMQCGANALPVRVYARIGEVEEARRLANELPSFEVGRELLISECLQGTEKAEHYRYLIERFERKIALYKNRVGE